MMNLGQPRDNVKVILPSIAYYILTGPWRRVWVRFGYDPRTDPAAKLYQVVDFRIKDSQWLVFNYPNLCSNYPAAKLYQVIHFRIKDS